MTPEQEAEGRKDVFARATFGSVRFNWGEKKGSCRIVVQSRLLILVPLNYPASRNARGIWVLLWDTIFGSWQAQCLAKRGLAEHSREREAG